MVIPASDLEVQFWKLSLNQFLPQSKPCSASVLASPIRKVSSPAGWWSSIQKTVIAMSCQRQCDHDWHGVCCNHPSSPCRKRRMLATIVA
eukprot:COSAG01_NODE_24037_length_793_cov_0.989914_1_plen_89_part_10